MASLALVCAVSPSVAQELPTLPLAMRDISYRTERVGDGAYAIIPDLPVRNTSGFIVGERGVLVVDGISIPTRRKRS
ncbi:MAG: hypothetical protein HC850_10000 [Rhodomicrobium sp.]|nr:hypothetical protein [Rhodomicrobium sp.]